jgi:ABC-type multidrug transport system permease subunit
MKKSEDMFWACLSGILVNSILYVCFAVSGRATFGLFLLWLSLFLTITVSGTCFIRKLRIEEDKAYKQN